MTDHARRAKLLAQVLASPDDDTPRLVLADWLTQRGDPRGEFISVQCAIAAGKGDYRGLVERERELMVQHAHTWTEHAKPFAMCTLHRGFIATIKTTASRFAADGAPFFERDPIETLVVQKPTNPALVELAAAPHLARLRRIELTRALTSEADVDATRQLLQAPQLATVRQLALHLKLRGDGHPAARRLFEDIDWPALELLQLQIESLDLVADPSQRSHFGVLTVLATAKLPALRALSIDPLAELAALQEAFPAARIRRLVR
jgi:uncharacterized protein (TIGR02996 family)